MLLAAGAVVELGQRAGDTPWPGRAPFALPGSRDLRQGSVRELRTLPGLGERLARAVAEERARRGAQPFRWEDVPGLGEVRAAALRAHLRARGLAPEPFAQGPARYPAEMPSRTTALVLLAALAGCGGAPPEGASTQVARALDPRAGEVGGAAQEATVEATPPAPSGAVAADEVRAAVLHLAAGEVHVQVLGAGREGVLFLHGARYSAADWLALGALAPVARRGLVAVALDWPGSGHSPAVASAPEPGALLAELVTALGLERVVLVAPSRGGAQALAWLARGEPRVAGLLALAPAGCEDFSPPDGPLAPIRLVWGAGDEVVPRAAGAALAGRLAGVELVDVPEVGHAWYLSAPARFHALLGAFLDELGWSAR